LSLIKYVNSFVPKVNAREHNHQVLPKVMFIQLECWCH